MWRSERRRASARQYKTLRPAEEQEINRALRESLKSIQTKLYENDTSSTDSSCLPCSPSKTKRPLAKRQKKRKSNGASTLSSLDNSLCGNGLATLAEPNGMECRSPMHLSVQSPLSDDSPVISESESLRLVLSTSSNSSRRSSITSTPKRSPKAIVSSAKSWTKKLPKQSPQSKKLVSKKKRSKHFLYEDSPKTKRPKLAKTEVTVGKGKRKQNISKNKIGVSKRKRLSKKVQQLSLTPNGSVVEEDLCVTVAEGNSEGADISPTTVTETDRSEQNPAEEKLEQPKNPTFSCTYPAQRKFASNHTPPSRYPDQDALDSLTNLTEVPRTEDFITFLCLRGSASVPENLRKFCQPWTPVTKRTQARSYSGKVSKSRLNGGSSAVKKLVYPTSFSPPTSKQHSSTSHLTSNN